jgi:hypothetical protein
MKKTLAIPSLLSAILLSACLQINLSNAATPDNKQLEEICEKSTSQSNVRPNPSWTWFNIIIGESTYEDLISNYGTPITRQIFPSIRKPLGCIYQYKLDDHTVFFYIMDGQIVAIETPAPSYLFGTGAILPLADFVEKYGRPEMVGFNSPYGSGYRTLVWLREGVQAFVSLGLELSAERPLLIDINRADIVSLVYSSPTSAEEYQESFISIWFHETRPESDIFEAYPQDPFEW